MCGVIFRARANNSSPGSGAVISSVKLGCGSVSSPLLLSSPLSPLEKELEGSVDKEGEIYDGPPHGGLRKTISIFDPVACGVDKDVELTEDLTRACMV